MTTKQCSKCSETKDIGEYNTYKQNGKSLPRPECKECSRAMSRAWKARNKKRNAEYQEKWKQDNRKEVSDYNKKYDKENRDAIQKRQTAARQIRKDNDSNFNLTCDLRSKLCHHIKTKGKYDSDYMEDLLGCAWEPFEVWLRYQFDDQMTFANYGTYWQIDHVQPCCIFRVTDDDGRMRCFHWTNLRPLKKEDNQSKTGKIIPKEIGDHMRLVDEFVAQLSEQDFKNYTSI